MNIYLYTKQEVLKALALNEDFSVETPKFENQGDVSLNLALILSKKLGQSPVTLAQEFVIKIAELPFVRKAEVASAGFINIFLKEEFLLEAFKESINETFGFNKDLGNGEKINIEYCSANPTGPIHIGHTRGTIFGDVLSSLLSKNGYNVTREYYINDAGGQIETLVKSVIIRAKQLNGENIEVPEGCYPGEYLIPIARKMLEKFGESAFVLQTEVKDFIISDLMEGIKQDLLKLKVKHDVFTSEATITGEGGVQKAIENLKSKGLIYKGVLPQPKGKLKEDWEEREQLLFKSTLFGDSEDRAILKSNGSSTYFASDIAYHKNKLDRGFNNMIVVLGADHLGYIKRITAATKALATTPEMVEITVSACQIVKFVENGEPIKMSKRKGTFTTLAEVLEEVNPDILRFMMLTKKNDSQMEFDISKVKEQSKENPIFYIQYAFARGNSLLKSFEGGVEGADLSLLKIKEELKLVKTILEYPKFIEMAVKKKEPHLIANYAFSLAFHFHALWNMGNENHELKFITENIETTKARMFMVKAVICTLSSIFSIFNITPLNKM